MKWGKEAKKYELTAIKKSQECNVQYDIAISNTVLNI